MRQGLQRTWLRLAQSQVSIMLQIFRSRKSRPPFHGLPLTNALVQQSHLGLFLRGVDTICSYVYPEFTHILYLCTHIYTHIINPHYLIANSGFVNLHTHQNLFTAPELTLVVIHRHVQNGKKFEPPHAHIPAEAGQSHALFVSALIL